MPDREKVINGLEQFRADLKPFCGNHADWERFDAALTMLKEQEELIKAMKRDLNLVRSCKACGNWTECTPDAPPESEEFKMWRDCGGSCKLNWTWRGV